MASEILSSIDGHIFRNVQGFYEKYFDSQKVKAVLSSAERQQLVGNDNCINDTLSDDLKRDDLSSWLKQAPMSSDLQWEQVCDSDSGISTMMLKKRTPNDNSEQKEFVRAIGVLMRPETRLYREGFTKLCVHASDVFAEDSLRFFIHAFMVWGTTIELWKIDRSGLYSSEPFDTRSERFFRALNVYHLLQEEHLGANTYFESTQHINPVFRRKSPGYDDDFAKINLEGPPLTVNGSFAFINDIPTIYFATRSPSTRRDTVVKFKWRREFECGEAKVFQSMKGQSPPGVVQLYRAKDIVSTSSLRDQLKFETAVQLSHSDNDNLAKVSSAPSLPECFNERDTTKSTRNPPYTNRILSCIATFPIGLELHHYQSPTQAIEGFRDALKGHRALYQEYQLLHRDISIFNILLTDTSVPNTEDLTKGFLIDLEGALDLKTTTQHNQIIGTVPFMAIRVLLGERPQTYRTDLESFLYSLIWFCIQPGSTKIRPPEGSRLWRWKGENDEELAKIKLRDMTAEEFPILLSEFHPDFRRFRGMAEGIRRLLFPVQPDGSLQTETDKTEEGTNSLYRDIILEFDKVV